MPVKKNKPKKAVVKNTKPTKKNKSLSTKEMRIAIAKDVLAQLKAKKIVATRGCWTDDPKLGSIDDFASTQLEKADKDSVEIKACDYASKVNKCRVCALGSLFLSGIRLYNGVSWTLNKEDAFFDLSHDLFDDIEKSPLNKYFSTKQLQLIEATFEDGDGSCWLSSDRDHVLARAYYVKYRDAEKRLIGIMNNIIDNEGTFNPITELSADDVIEYAANSL